MKEKLLRAITDICSQLNDFVLNNISETALWPSLLVEYDGVLQ
jgi:hypothetical protein